MKSFNLTLCKDDGEVINEWKIHVLNERELEEWEDPDDDWEPNIVHFSETEVKEMPRAVYFDPEIMDEIKKQLEMS